MNHSICYLDDGGRRFGARDLGIADIHTLAMLLIALILLVVSMAAMLVFCWALVGMG